MLHICTYQLVDQWAIIFLFLRVNVPREHITPANCSAGGNSVRRKQRMCPWIWMQTVTQMKMVMRGGDGSDEEEDDTFGLGLFGTVISRKYLEFEVDMNIALWTS
jgi:hypothetical protein